MSPFYPVRSFRYSYLTEGVHAGRAALFVRLQPSSFQEEEGDYSSSNSQCLVASQIADKVAEILGFPEDNIEGASVVLEGDEPCDFSLVSLIDQLGDIGRRVHLQTAGHLPIPHNATWVTMCPNFSKKHPLRENWARASEIKLLCRTPRQIELDLTRTLVHIEHCDREPPSIWLHPHPDKRDDDALLLAMIEEVKGNTLLRLGFDLGALYPFS